MSNSYFIECPNPEGIKGTHKVNITEWGNKNNTKTLICVHGLTRNSRDFDFIARELEHEYRIICPDMPGRGKSEWLANHQLYNYITYVADMLHIMQTLGLFQCHWIGTSMGGLIGMMIAANVPGIITKLVINDIGAEVPGKGLERIGGYVGKESIFKTVTEAEEFFRFVCRPWGKLDDAHIKHITTHSISPVEGGFRIAYDPNIGKAFKDEAGNVRKIEDINLWEIWNKVSCPVLLLHGEESDILSSNIANKMAESKNVELINFPNIGHIPSLMQNDQINLVKNWLIS